MGHVVHRKTWIVLDSLADLILENVDGCIVDIGIGKSTKILAEYAVKYKRKHYSCDLDEELRKWYPLHKNHILFIGKDREFIEQFDMSESPSIVFLDGGHSYDEVTRQSTFFLSIIKPGAIMFIHDTYPPKDKYEVWKVRQKLEKREDLQVFTWTYENQAQNWGLTMLTKKDPGAPYYRR